MKKTKNVDKALMILTVILIILALYLAFTNGYRVFMLNQNQEEQLIIPKGDIKECCTYLDEDNIERICTVFADYDCSRCDVFCKT